MACVLMDESTRHDVMWNAAVGMWSQAPGSKGAGGTAGWVPWVPDMAVRRSGGARQGSHGAAVVFGWIYVIRKIER